MCDANDIGAHSDPQSGLAGGQPAVILYDRVPGGIGLSEAIYQSHARLMQAALELVTECGCQDGCPSCVGVSGQNSSGGKQETLALLHLLNDLPLPV
jgi:DEAD/DEAH box helicase domain-containing protein